MNVAMKNDHMKMAVCYFALLMACAGTLFLSVPTIGHNIDDPNRIIYFNADEGGLMDEVWYYYSGVKRDSFQWDFDYGLEMLYLADVARLSLSRFVDFTPGTFVLILRWVHLIAWISCFFVLWRLIGRHFGRGWQQALGVLLLAVRPASGYFFSNLKPEPLVLLIMLIGLNYALRIVECPSRKNVLIASAMAALAFIVKFAGLFLLPAIIAALYFAKRRGENTGAHVIKTLQINWIFPALAGLMLIVAPVLPLIFYVRKSTGFTWFEQYGLCGSIMRNNDIFYIWAAGLLLLLYSFAVILVRRRPPTYAKKIVEFAEEINSYALIVCALFFGLLRYSDSAGSYPRSI